MVMKKIVFLVVEQNIKTQNDIHAKEDGYKILQEQADCSSFLLALAIKPTTQSSFLLQARHYSLRPTHSRWETMLWYSQFGLHRYLIL